jgi:hypothetical protein
MGKKLLALALPLVVLGAVVKATLSEEQQLTTRQIARTLPDKWVPFTADVLQSQDDDPGSSGKFARDSNGSAYFEMFNGATVYATIKNIPQRTFYQRHMSEPSFWVAHPMVLPPEGWNPITEIPVSDRMVRLPQPFERMEAWEWTYNSGRRNIAIPDLNFFQVRRELTVRNRKVVFSNIRRGEPDPALFVPPPGVEVRKSRRPHGIVYTPDSASSAVPE